jgi:orotate phosphoribosyltransferase
MNTENDPACIIASLLLQSNAIKLNTENPFTWVSGIKSPIYCDNRVTLSYPQVRRQIALQFAKTIKQNHPDVRVVAGVATGAIAHGILVAEELGMPFVYVRNSTKSHGLANQVEGRILPGEKTIVIEDLVSTGKSSISAVQALRQAGFVVDSMLAIFSYGLKEAATQLKLNSCSLNTLCDFNCLMQTALNEQLISQEQLLLIEKWREDPWGYGK